MCKQLGFPGGVAAMNRKFGHVNTKQSILLDSVNCLGNETNLFDCQHLRIGKHYCTHTRDVGVVCGM